MSAGVSAAQGLCAVLRVASSGESVSVDSTREDAAREAAFSLDAFSPDAFSPDASFLDVSFTDVSFTDVSPDARSVDDASGVGGRAGPSSGGGEEGVMAKTGDIEKCGSPEEDGKA